MIKNKIGFTLIELLTVIVIFSILIIITLPNLIKLFNKSKEDSFLNETKIIYREATSKFISDSLLNTDEKEYYKTYNDKSHSLKLSGRDEINYYIKLSKGGKVTNFIACDGTYTLRIINQDGIKIENIDESKLIDNMNCNFKYSDISNVKCDYYDIIVYSNGEINVELETKNSWQSDGAPFESNHIVLPRSGYHIVYTKDTIDLSKYNSLVVKKTNGIDRGRVGFRLYPEKVNNGGFTINPSEYKKIDDYYVFDISGYRRKDLKLYLDQWGSANSGNIYYIMLSNRYIYEYDNINENDYINNIECEYIENNNVEIIKDDIVYLNGKSSIELDTKNSWQSDGAPFESNHIVLPTSGYHIVYTKDVINISNYRTLIVKKTNGIVSSRVGFAEFPERVNNSGNRNIPTTYKKIDEDLYAFDLIDFVRNDLHLFLDQYYSANSGNIYFIMLTNRYYEDVIENYQFVLNILNE